MSVHLSLNDAIQIDRPLISTTHHTNKKAIRVCGRWRERNGVQVSGPWLWFIKPEEVLPNLTHRDDFKLWVGFCKFEQLQLIFLWQN